MTEELRNELIRYMAVVKQMTYQEVGDIFDISRQRVHQIVRKKKKGGDKNGRG